MATTKQASTLSKITTAGSHDFVMTANDSTGHANLITPSNLVTPILLMQADHVRIAYERLPPPGETGSTYLALSRLSDYASEVANGRSDEACGVALMIPGHPIVIYKYDGPQKNPSNNSTYWSSTIANTYGADTYVKAVQDMDGYTKCKALSENSLFQGTGNAFGYCQSVSTTMIKAGEWYLPTLGEMHCIMANRTLINYAMSLIGGDTLSDSYGTSTLKGVGGWWTLNIISGVTASIGTATRIIRPVSLIQLNNE